MIINCKGIVQSGTIMVSVYYFYWIQLDPPSPIQKSKELFPISVFCEGAIECSRLIQPNRGNSIATFNFHVFLLCRLKENIMKASLTNLLILHKLLSSLKGLPTLWVSPQTMMSPDDCSEDDLTRGQWSSVSGPLRRWQVTRPASHIRMASPGHQEIIVHNEEQLIARLSILFRPDYWWKFSKKRKLCE